MPMHQVDAMKEASCLCSGQLIPDSLAEAQLRNRGTLGNRGILQPIDGRQLSHVSTFSSIGIQRMSECSTEVMLACPQPCKP
ncbi:hypothetical protein GS393_02033 [Pseudomonas savastanoi pv. phaseolicola]|nr:hypothetical protein [Pseudomonas savastanoi pv. phaseolicola]